MPSKYHTEEVWSLIIPHLRTPTPLPLSRPPRSEIQQSSLCAIMRTSKLLHSIAEPILYQHVVTDSLYHLFRDIAPSAIISNSPLHQSKLRQFAQTKTLTIEYFDAYRDIPSLYEVLSADHHGDEDDLVAKTWAYCGGDSEDRWLLLLNCHREVERLTQLLEQVRRSPLSAILPRLHSVSVASIYGFDPKVWQAFHSEFGSEVVSQDAFGRPLPFGIPRPIVECGIYFHEFLSSGRLRSVCVRDAYGPLAITPVPGIPQTSTFFPTSYPLTSITHFTSDTEKLPAPIIRPARWMYDGPCTADAPIIHDIGIRLRMVHAIRSQLAPNSPLDLVVTCSTPHYGYEDFGPETNLFGPRGELSVHLAESRTIPPDLQRRLGAELARGAKRHLGHDFMTGQKVSLADKLVWESSARSAPCEACGYSVNFEAYHDKEDWFFVSDL